MPIHGYDFTFTSSTGTVRIRGDGYESREEMEAAFKRALDAFGYESPRWWQFWRWGEALPGPYRKAE